VIRHVLFPLSLAVVALTVAVVIAALRRPLMLAVGLALFLAASTLPAVLATITLPSEARTAHPEDRSAPLANTSKERDTRRPHTSRKPGVDSGSRLWDAQSVTV
jgi:hypothetical protein